MNFTLCSRDLSTLSFSDRDREALTEAVQKMLSAVVVIHGAKDGEIIALLATVLFAAGITSVLPPARRAASVDPVVTLRYE